MPEVSPNDVLLSSSDLTEPEFITRHSIDLLKRQKLVLITRILEMQFMSIGLDRVFGRRKNNEGGLTEQEFDIVLHGDFRQFIDVLDRLRDYPQKLQLIKRILEDEHERRKRNDVPSSSSGLTTPEATRPEENLIPLAHLCYRANNALYASVEEREEILPWLRNRFARLEAQVQSYGKEVSADAAPLPPKSDTFGECIICLEDEPLDPVGCIHCLQQVGCQKCVDRWYEESCHLSQKRCPLCRHEWEDGAGVLDIFELKLS